MSELSFKNSPDGWPKTAELGGRRLTFSGTFSTARAVAERSLKRTGQAFSIGLWTLVAVAVASGSAAAFFGYERGDSLFFLHRSILNLLLWAGVLAGLYLWAKSTQQEIDAAGTNLLRFDGENGNGEVDVYGLFSETAKVAWNESLALAKARGHETPTATDLFLSLCNANVVQVAFLRLGVAPRDIAAVIGNYAKLAKDTPEAEGLLDELPFRAFQKAVLLRAKSVDPLVLMCTIAETVPDKHIVKATFFNLNLSQERLETLASWLLQIQILSDDVKLLRSLSRTKPDSGMSRGMTAVPTPYLDQYSQDMTSRAKYGQVPVAYGRHRDLAEMLKLLSESRGVLVLGSQGSGRSTLVNELAYAMAAEQVPAALQDRRLVKLEVAGILGSKGKPDAVLLGALHEAVRSGNIVLVLEDVEQLARASSGDGLPLLDVLVNFLGSVRLPCVATSNIESKSDILAKTPNFDQAFTVLELKPLTRRETLLACCIRASLLESQKGVTFLYPAVEQAVDLTDTYVHGPAQPEKAISVLVEASSRASKGSVIAENDIAAVVSQRTHIPTATLGEEETDKLLNLEQVLAEQVVGQKPAVAAVAEALRRARSGLSSGSRPLASFLFLGPTGVGKTELARALSVRYFGSAEYLLRLDMSEYRGGEGMGKLIGTQGSPQDTPLVRHIKTYPFCLLLCDEFEKASNEIHNLFLQILEDGRLTSASGEVLDLTHSMIIATSNAGALDIQAGIKAGKKLDDMKADLLGGALLKVMAPELLNRFDGIILFSPLSPDEVKQITRMQLQHLAAQLLEKGMKVAFSDAVADDVAKNAYDPLLGARPVRRYVQDHVEGFVAKLILEKKLSRGSEVTVDFQNGRYLVTT